MLKCMQEELGKKASMNEYLPVQGAPVVRDLIAKYYSRLTKLDIQGSQLLLGPGSKILMYILMEVVNFKHLILPSPSWVTYEPQGIITGKKVIWVDTTYEDKWKINMVALDKLLTQLEDPEGYKLLVLNCPSTPTGMLYTADQYKALALICKKHKLLVLSYEIYNEMTFNPEAVYDTLYRYYPEGTFIVNGILKWAGAGGWRLGYMVVPTNMPEVMANMLKFCSQTFSCVCAPLQYATIPLWEEVPEAREYARKSCNLLKIIADHIVPKLLKAGVSLIYPDGAFYLFTDFGQMPKTKALLEKYKTIENQEMNFSPWVFHKLLQETGVALLSAVYFGRKNQEEVSTRIAYVDFDGGEALEKVDQIDSQEFFNTIAAKMLTGIDLMLKWWLDPTLA